MKPRTVLLPILLLHSRRHHGLMFLAPGAVYAGIPRQFTYPAALGDFLAAIRALIAIPAIATRSRGAAGWSGCSTSKARWTSSRPSRSPPRMTPGRSWGRRTGSRRSGVPALIVTHYITFVILLKHWPA